MIELPIHVAFQDEVSLGALLILVLGGAGTVWYTVRSNASQVWQSNYQAERAARQLIEEDRAKLNEEHHEALKLIGEQKQAITKLESLPNLERVVTLMASSAERADMKADERMSHAMELLQKDHIELRADSVRHEQNAQDRHELQMAQMKEITDILRKLNGH